MKLLDMTPAEKIAFFMTRLYDNKLTTTSGGNLSIMDSDGTLWISPSGIDKAHLTADDIMWVTPDGVVHGKHRPPNIRSTLPSCGRAPTCMQCFTLIPPRSSPTALNAACPRWI